MDTPGSTSKPAFTDAVSFWICSRPVLKRFGDSMEEGGNSVKENHFSLRSSCCCASVRSPEGVQSAWVEAERTIPPPVGAPLPKSEPVVERSAPAPPPRCVSVVAGALSIEGRSWQLSPDTGGCAHAPSTSRPAGGRGSRWVRPPPPSRTGSVTWALLAKTLPPRRGLPLTACLL